MEKYKNIFARYKLDSYIRLWVAGLTYNSLDDIQCVINSTQSTNTDIMILNRKIFNFKVMRAHKRKHPPYAKSQTADESMALHETGATVHANATDNPSPTNTILPFADHPFYSLRELVPKFNKGILNIGQFYKYLLPF